MTTEIPEPIKSETPKPAPDISMESFKSAESFKNDFTILRNSIRHKCDYSITTLRINVANGNENAKEELRDEVKGYRNELQNFYDELPTESDMDSNINGEKEKKAEKKKILELKKKITDTISNIEREFKISFTDEMKDIEEKSPEKINERNREKLKRVNNDLSSVYSAFVSTYADIENRKKNGIKISEVERVQYIEKINKNLSNYFIHISELENLLSKAGREKIDESDSVQSVSLSSISDIRKKTEEDSDSILSKIQKSLDKPVDESVEKFKKLDAELDKTLLDIARINSEIVKEIDGGGKIKDELKSKLIFDLSEIENKMREVGAENNKIRNALGANLTEDQIRRVNNFFSKFVYTTSCYVKATEKLDNKKEYNAKDQRSNAVAISDRLRNIEKNMSEDYDKLSIGKKYSPDKREEFEVMIDVEIINVREAKNNLDALPDIPENQPTRTLIASIIERAEKRIGIQKEKLDKERMATEKEILAKLDEAEKEIEKIEENIREVNRKDSEGKMRFDENRKLKGVLDNLWTPFVKYNSGQTYHNQINVKDSLEDPKASIKEVKDWIEKMPEMSDKEQKLKRKLMKKARRMNRRVTSAKWRHYMTLGAYDKGAYLGDKLGSGIVGAAGDVMDKIFG